MRSVSAVGWSGVATTESSLVERCASGDEEACRALVKAHRAMVFQLAVALLGDREEALDVSQEVFLRIFRTIGTVRGETALRTWIYRIVVNQARNRRRWWARRGRSAQVSLESYAEGHGDPVAARHTSADVELDRQRLAAHMRAALVQLPFD